MKTRSDLNKSTGIPTNKNVTKACNRKIVIFISARFKSRVKARFKSQDHDQRLNYNAQNNLFLDTTKTNMFLRLVKLLT